MLDMSTASAKEKDYFRRVAALNRALTGEQPPDSLAEAFERLDLLRLQLGPLAEPGKSGPADGDLESHLAYLNRLRSIDDPRRT